MTKSAMHSTLRVQAHDERLPRYHRLRDLLSGEIAQGRFKPEQAIPTEAELASSHKVSVGTVRKAIDALVADGLLERFQGKGTFVRRPKFDSSLFRFFRFQTRAGETRIPESRILKREVTSAPAPVAAALNLPAKAPAIHLSRMRSLDGKPLLVESIWVAKDRFAALLNLDVREFGDLLYPLYEQFCGQVVASAQETLTAEAAGSQTAKLLDMPVGAPVIVVERLAYSYDRQPLEWRRSRGAAEQFRYQVEIR
ncbi:MAG: GntR family transcriptional regulator [Lacunisphaera sp.]|nr:GntR family transcriptional regulator [Lacunisphaera sp.]MDB6165938.1 GntR family transcriptional regulator [Lacunisphaera sp.]